MALAQQAGDEPYWLHDSQQNNAPEAPKPNPYNNNNYNSSSNSSGDANSGSSGPKRAMTVFCFIVNVGLMVLYGYTAYLALIALKGTGSSQETGQAFVGSYMMLFGFIFALFELVQLCPNTFIDKWFKKSFGFLYGPLGKSCYLIFIGVMSFALDGKTFPILTGILVLGWAVLQGILYLAFPKLFDVKEKYDPSKDNN